MLGKKSRSCNQTLLLFCLFLILFLRFCGVPFPSGTHRLPKAETMDEFSDLETRNFPMKSAETAGKPRNVGCNLK